MIEIVIIFILMIINIFVVYMFIKNRFYPNYEKFDIELYKILKNKIENKD